MTDTTTQTTADNTQAGGGTQTTAETAAPQAALITSEVDASKDAEAAKTTDAPGAKTETGDVAYDLKLPEGMPLDEAVATEFKALAKELKLAPEAAQKFVDLEVKRLQAATAAHLETVKSWRDTVVKDAELGGDKLAESMATARKAVALGGTELTELLKSTGLDNHPTVFKWAHAIGKALSEDRMVKGSTAAAPKLSDAQVMYGTPTKS